MSIRDQILKTACIDKRAAAGAVDDVLTTTKNFLSDVDESVRQLGKKFRGGADDRKVYETKQEAFDSLTQGKNETREEFLDRSKRQVKNLQNKTPEEGQAIRDADRLAGYGTIGGGLGLAGTAGYGATEMLTPEPEPEYSLF